VSRRAEFINESVPGTRHIIVLHVVLLRVTNSFVVGHLNVKRRETRWQIGIREAFDCVEVPIEHVDVPWRKFAA